jgi:F-type H+-transporting ATPase subunit c
MKALQFLWLAFVAVLVVLAGAGPLFAAENVSTYALAGAGVGAGLGAGIVIIGAGYGFGRIGSAALESMARQPEVANRIGVNMIVIAALLEGVAFFALVVCLLVTLLRTNG